MSYERSLSIEKLVGDFVLEETQKLALKIDRDVVIQTPVDTGRAASNWIVTLGRPTSANRNDIIGQSAAIENGALSIGVADAYQDIYIQNNLPYIGRLNDGSSEKAPSKYVDVIISRRAAEEEEII
jgi:hypothetical protein